MEVEQQKVINLINHVNPHPIQIDYEMVNKWKRQRDADIQAPEYMAFTYWRKNIAQFAFNFFFLQSIHNERATS